MLLRLKQNPSVAWKAQTRRSFARLVPLMMREPLCLSGANRLFEILDPKVSQVPQCGPSDNDRRMGFGVTLGASSMRPRLCNIFIGMTNR
jgi:hypothetical protein